MNEALGRSQGGYGTKLSIVCDGRGAPLGVSLAPGQAHDSPNFARTLASVRVKRRPRALAADRSYRSQRVRDVLRSRRIRPVIPAKVNERPNHRERFAPDLYRRRNVVERLVGHLKEWRRVATRYDKLAATYAGVVSIAVIGRLLVTISNGA
jgi:transposase